jgi:hypothetical protein
MTSLPKSPSDVLIDMDMEDEEEQEEVEKEGKVTAAAAEVNADVDLEAGMSQLSTPSLPLPPTPTPVRLHTAAKRAVKKHVQRAHAHLREQVLSWRTRFYLFLIGCVCAAATLTLRIRNDVVWIDAFNAYSEILANTSYLMLCLLVIVPLLPEDLNEHINRKRAAFSLI